MHAVGLVVPTDSVLAVAGNILNLVGAVIVVAVAYVASRGYRETRSPTLLRLTLAFSLLGVSLALTGVIGMAELGPTGVLTGQSFLTASILLLAAGALETAGYFFLAFAHVLNVMASARIGLLPLLFVPASPAAAALKSLSLYFLLYGFVETVLSYARLKKFLTLVIGAGLGCLALGEFVQWFAAFYPTNEAFVVASLMVKVVGFSALYIPVLSFSARRESP